MMVDIEYPYYTSIFDVPDSITRIGTAQGICTVQHAVDECLASGHHRVPLCGGMTISIDAGKDSAASHTEAATPCNAQPQVTSGRACWASTLHCQ